MPYLTLVDSTAERDFTQHAEVQERNGHVGRGMPVYNMHSSCVLPLPRSSHSPAGERNYSLVS